LIRASLNTDAELNAYPAEYDRQLDRIFDEYGLIVCGWSAEWDHALRAAFLRAPNRRYPVYWTARGALGNGAQDLVNHRGARVISVVDADSFFTSLLQRVESLEQSQRQNPQSIELLVRSTERYLAKPEYRIQLEELFVQEVNRLLKELDAPEFDPQKPLNQTDFRARVQRYESITEPLARMVGVLGRWGDDGELPLVANVIGSLYRQSEKIDSGKIAYLNIRSYPAVLVFTAYGLGLTRNDRWRILHRLFSTTIARQYKQSRRAVEQLFLTAWKGAEGNAWKQIEGLEKRKTPLSDHLVALFSDWGESFIRLLPDFELMFERFELLAAFAYLEKHKKDEVVAELSGSNFAWLPMGRASWHSPNREKLIAEIQAEPMKTTLVKAGFGKGDPEFLGLFVQTFNRMADAISW
jgi:hypothetical protein